MDGAEVIVKSQLLKIVSDLEAIQKSATQLSNTMKQGTATVGQEVKEQTKQVEGGLQKMQNFGRRVADQLRQDFMSLASIGSLTSGLKLSENFSGSIKEAVNLSDTVRRLGSIFGIAQSDFVSFQTKMQRGLGEIGVSSEAAANALKGLAETPVRGQANLIAYSKTASELASISGERGQEGAIAKGAAGVITSRGGNVNDLSQLSSVSQEILQIRKATGKSVTEITSALSGLYQNTNKDFQKNLQGGGSTTLAAASLLGGPQATSFMEKYLSMDRISRKGLSAQGFNVFGQNGQLDAQAIERTMNQAKSRGLGDAQAGLKTFGFGDDEAKGFIRLSEALKANQGVIQGASKQVVDLNEEYRKSMGLGDSFRASINRIKGIFSPVISAASQGATGMLGSASQSTAGAAAVVGGGAILAAVLTGGGLRGIGSSLLGGEAKARAIEAATGEHVQKVEVINFPSSLGGTAAAGSGLLGKAAKVAGIGALAYGAGAGVAQLAGQTGESSEGEYGFVQKHLGQGSADVFEKLTNILAKANNTVFGTSYNQMTHVKIDLNKKDLKAAVLPGRGSAN